MVSPAVDAWRRQVRDDTQSWLKSKFVDHDACVLLQRDEAGFPVAFAALKHTASDALQLNRNIARVLSELHALRSKPSTGRYTVKPSNIPNATVVYQCVRDMLMSTNNSAMNIASSPWYAVSMSILLQDTPFTVADFGFEGTDPDVLVQTKSAFVNIMSAPREYVAASLCANTVYDVYFGYKLLRTDVRSISRPDAAWLSRRVPPLMKYTVNELYKFCVDDAVRFDAPENYVAFMDSVAWSAGFLAVGLFPSATFRNTRMWQDVLAKKPRVPNRVRLRECLPDDTVNEELLSVLGDVAVCDLLYPVPAEENVLAWQTNLTEAIDDEYYSVDRLRTYRMCVDVTHNARSVQSDELARLLQLLRVLPHFWTHGDITFPCTRYQTPLVFYSTPHDPHTPTVENYVHEVRRCVELMQTDEPLRSTICEFIKLKTRGGQTVLLAAEKARLPGADLLGILLKADTPAAAESTRNLLQPVVRQTPFVSDASEKNIMKTFPASYASEFIAYMKRIDRMPLVLMLPTIHFMQLDALRDVRCATLDTRIRGLHCARITRFKAECVSYEPFFYLTEELPAKTFQCTEANFAATAKEYNDALCSGVRVTLVNVVRWFHAFEWHGHLMCVDGLAFVQNHTDKINWTYEQARLKSKQLVSLDLRCTAGKTDALALWSCIA